ncbi:hypothetical protein L2E82_30048 [Cichorium intybus]|uniref:Uncharacterized protein n=1 Tax=Cichorium intybus TaxID=13427 RepID=A0ACB9CZP9_CICIN|nr:hypothetical protein L2E82_30048 [Cichorium intybus]
MLQNLKSRCFMNLEYSAQGMWRRRCRVGLGIEAWDHQYHLPSHHHLQTTLEDSTSALCTHSKFPLRGFHMIIISLLRQ